MRTASLISTLALGLSVVALPATDSGINLQRRQDINFTLADAVADTDETDGVSTDASSIAAVVADINDNPLPQEKRDLDRRAESGYSASISLDNVAINAPLNCHGQDTYMGSKMWNDNNIPFLEDRCAAACTAQSAYNLKHPPSTGSPKLCQFYNTYLLLKNGVAQGQYCSLYTQAWDISKATNNGQWRGNDHYTISNSVMATNVTNAGNGCTTLGTNLVANPGFETAFSGEWRGPANRCNNVAYRIGTQSGGAYEGGSYGEAYYYASNVCPAILQQTTTGLSNTSRYTLSFYLWPRTIDAGSICSFNTYLGNVLLESFVPTSWIHGPNSYVKHTISGITPSATSEDLVFSFSCSQGGAAYIDFDLVSLQQESYS